ncbi:MULTISPECIES: hypothetical protein [unclassified Solwaraspora]|uniref:hypothetical protein n=1 Tax=unclassified Solwaraspora TaxID=2627926 RepID=UPI00248C97D0|nr:MULTISPECIES: hypothetical protein [unclassified Solwaraspora]WBB96921.1 hypothetical protein O7553_27230 [Solwaraspora sp. WMMA2059]WBC19175.1 hypothetical protein O7543_20140 [Solwaraspora sp. WMMA2080]WJK33410.1 hypothetical protein O7610_22345 [Solwaraspora sp. WMMA2065]WJK41668.1 hypothetical protein O7608_04390 [Solwaraspora sp. WMMA2056]
MAGTVAEVIAQIARASTGLSSAAATALRAQQEVTDAHQSLSAASAGASARAVTNATTEWKTAADKAGKVARLLIEAAGHLNAYANRIAPGSAPTEPTLAGPTGEELLADTTRRSESRRGVGSFLDRLARRTEDVQDTAKTTAELGDSGLNILRDLATPPPGSQSTTGTSAPTVAFTDTRPKLEAGDAAGHLVVAALIAGLAARRADRYIRQGLARLRQRERSD